MTEAKRTYGFAEAMEVYEQMGGSSEISRMLGQEFGPCSFCIDSLSGRGEKDFVFAVGVPSVGSLRDVSVAQKKIAKRISEIFPGLKDMQVVVRREFPAVTTSHSFGL